MTWRKFWPAVALTAAILALAVVWFPILAQQRTTTVGQGYGPGYGMGYGPGYGPGYGYGSGYGPGFGSGPVVGFDPAQHEAIAAALGMTSEELHTARREGRTIAELARQRGVDLQTVVEAALALRRANLEAQVAAGYLTQSQAEWMLAEMEAHLRAQFNSALAVGPGYGQFGLGYGLRLLDQAAAALGMARVELLTELQAGKSIAMLADERGVDLQTAIIDPLLEEERTWLQQRTRLSQRERDLLMAQLRDQLRLRVHTPGTGLGLGLGYGYGYSYQVP